MSRIDYSVLEEDALLQREDTTFNLGARLERSLDQGLPKKIRVFLDSGEVISDVDFVIVTVSLGVLKVPSLMKDDCGKQLAFLFLLFWLSSSFLRVCSIRRSLPGN